MMKIACLVVAVLFLRHILLKRKLAIVSISRSFTYVYKRHPLDDAQYFSVNAESQGEANKLASEKFQQMFQDGHVVTTNFYSVSV